jgi:hypothetical protein
MLERNVDKVLGDLVLSFLMNNTVLFSTIIFSDKEIHVILDQCVSHMRNIHAYFVHGLLSYMTINTINVIIYLLQTFHCRHIYFKKQ